MWVKQANVVKFHVDFKRNKWLNQTVWMSYGKKEWNKKAETGRVCVHVCVCVCVSTSSVRNVRAATALLGSGAAGILSDVFDNGFIWLVRSCFLSRSSSSSRVVSCLLCLLLSSRSFPKKASCKRRLWSLSPSEFCVKSTKWPVCPSRKGWYGFRKWLVS